MFTNGVLVGVRPVGNSMVNDRKTIGEMDFDVVNAGQYHGHHYASLSAKVKLRERQIAAQFGG